MVDVRRTAAQFGRWTAVFRPQHAARRRQFDEYNAETFEATRGSSNLQQVLFMRQRFEALSIHE